jgi:hypothetical protein
MVANNIKYIYFSGGLGWAGITHLKLRCQPLRADAIENSECGPEYPFVVGQVHGI